MTTGRNDFLDVQLGTETVELLNRPDVEEVYINADGFIWFISSDVGKHKTDIYIPPEKAIAIIELIAGQTGKIVNEEIPRLSCEISGYNCRFQGQVPPIVANPQFNIRKPASKIYTLEEYVQSNCLSPKYYDFLQQAIKERKNILVVGGTRSGKTTFLNAIIDGISKLTPDHRIITIEDVEELHCNSEDYSGMWTKQDVGEHGVRYNATMALMDCMRRSPDRIIIGEVRDGAAYALLKAWNTGHEGGTSTVHANNAIMGLSRILMLAQENPEASANETTIKKLISETINVIVSIVFTDLGNGVKGRKINEIITVNGYDSREDKYLITKI